MSLRLTAGLKTGLLCLLIVVCHTTHAQLGNTSSPSLKEKTRADTCLNSEQVEKIIADAISIGAPLYNSGYKLFCYRIYEWAGYKILYEYGTSCKDVEKILKAAIEKSHGDYSDLEKAWIMRAAFDKILGVPTESGDPEKKPEIKSKNS